MSLKYRGVEYQIGKSLFVATSRHKVGKYRGAAFYAKETYIHQPSTFHVTVKNLRYRGIDHLGSGYLFSDHPRELQFR